MRSTEFAYWLQGWFEINEAVGFTLGRPSEALHSIVEKHLALVFEVEETPSKFCLWMSGMLDAGNYLDEPDLQKIKAKLSAEFVHVIDPSYPADKQDVLNAIHSFPPTVQPVPMKPGTIAIPPMTQDQKDHITKILDVPEPDLSTVIGGPSDLINVAISSELVDTVKKTLGVQSSISLPLAISRALTNWVENRRPASDMRRPPGPHINSFQFIKGMKMGYDGVTFDPGHHMHQNNEAYEPGARC